MAQKRLSFVPSAISDMWRHLGRCESGRVRLSMWQCFFSYCKFMDSHPIDKMAVSGRGRFFCNYKIPSICVADLNFIKI